MPILSEDETAERARCVVVVDRALPAGKAANAAAVIALTLGKRHPHLAGADLVDASGVRHPGLIHIGIAILTAPSPDLGAIREKAVKRGLDVVDFPVQGQETTNYSELGDRVSRISPEDMLYIGIGLFGGHKDVGRVAGSLPLLR